MPRLTPILYRFGLAILLGLGVATAASAQPARDLDARLDRLGQTLSLSADQSSALDAIAARYSGAAADLWAAAAEVRAVLTDAQIDQLQQAVQARRAERPARAERPDRAERPARRRGDRMRPSDGQRPRQGQHGDRAGRRERPAGQRAAGEPRQRLTDDQREAVRAIRDDVRQQARALAEQLRAGAISDDQFVDRTRALREDGARRMAATLPAEMARRQAERQAHRDAEEAARDRALRLTDAQKRQLQTFRLDRVRESPAMRPTLDEDGQVDREARRAAMRERREATREARGDHRDAMADVLTEDQQDLVFLHRALAMGSRGMHGPDGRRGGRHGR